MPDADRSPVREAVSWPEYWREVGRRRVTEQLRATCFFVLVLQGVFLGLDRWAYPEHFDLFFPMRLAVDVLLLGVLLKTRFSHPAASQIAVPAAVAAEVLVMTLATGGPHSSYYVGLILVFVGMPVLQPLRAVEAAWISGVFCAGFAASPLFVAAPPRWEEFGIALVFIGSGAFESVVSCSVLTRARLRDFAQRREIERARDALKQLDREKSRFTANIHHELRTPLTLTLAPLEGLLSGEFGEVSELQRSYLRSMHSNSLRLLKLINNLLDLARIEGRQLSIVRRPTRLAELVDELVAGSRPLAEQKGLALVARGFHTLPPMNVDREGLEKVVVNLLGNALKFTPPGGRIELVAEAGADGGAHFVVADTGPGIPGDQLERIFDRFAQVDDSSTRRYEGTGIGLALTRELVQLHGGRVWAESDGPGRGTRMHVSLPPAPADAEDGPEEAVLETSEGSPVALERSLAALEADIDFGRQERGGLLLAELERSVERSRFEGLDGPDPAGFGAGRPPGPEAAEVLVVEDNRDMRRLLVFLLQREFRVRVARDGREGLQRALESAPDLILTDVMMPVMTGTELCRAVKNDPELRGIPVVLVTSKAEREMKIEGLELGADDYVAKPFHPRELLARVRSLVRLRRLQGELRQRNQELEHSNGELGKALAELRETEVQLVQSERLAAVGELAAGVAHEVNNPVNFALNALRTLRSSVDDVRAFADRAAELSGADAAGWSKLRDEFDTEELSRTLGELVSIAAEGMERTSRLVSDLRDFAARGPVGGVPVDLARGLRSTLQLVGHVFAQAGVRVELQLAPALPPVRGDSGALNQVFLNLLKNAAEAFEGGEGTVFVDAQRQGPWIDVRIRDEGVGIPPDLRERLFEPFFSTRPRGTGLGLSISRRIVGEHGGRIDCASGPGRGTTFTVRLPAMGVEG